LWAFNDERVVRAVAASPVPIISGVGHETDFTLTDFASDLRAATPTAAAELATPITVDELRGGTNYFAEQLKMQISTVLDRYHINVDDLRVRLGYASPLKHIQQDAQSLDGLLHRLNTQQTHRQDLMRTKLKGLGRRLDALSPQAVLARGYAVLTRQTDQKIVGSVDDANAGDALKVRVVDGEFDVKVS